MICSFFSRPTGCCFSLLMDSFAVQKQLLSLNVVPLFLSNLKDYHQDQCRGAYYCLCLLGVSWFQVPNPFRSLIHFGFIFVWYKIMIQFHSLAQCPVLSTSFIEDTVLPLLYILGSVSQIDHICLGLFLGSLFFFSDLCARFYANRTLLYYSFLVQLVQSRTHHAP